MPELIHNEVAAIISASLARLGLTEVVISPGSRSAPLSLMFARQGCFRIQTVLDERAAAYIALGKALATRKPVALICTSGTALLNYAPAIAEAWYQRVPLVVLSADRPIAWLDQGDGQVVHQAEALRTHLVGYATAPEQLHDDSDRWQLRRNLSELWQQAVQQRGPVQLNVPLREPLYQLPEPFAPETQAVYHSYRSSGEQDIPEALVHDWHRASSIWLLPGAGSADELQQQAVEALAADPRVLVVAEPLSNITPTLAGIDELLRITGTLALPELIISWGGSWLSKRLKQALRAHPHTHWRIDPLGRPHDSSMRLGALWLAHEGEALTALATLPRGRGDYARQQQEQAAVVLERLNPLWAQLPHSDLAVMRQLLSWLPANAALHLGNSMPVRYQQFAAYGTTQRELLHANRGTAGIDGVTSTALGFASCWEGATVLITGELSFLYDLNAFTIDTVPPNFKVVVLHNGGGDIFRIIDGPRQQPELETLFATPRSAQIDKLAEGWGLGVFEASDALSLRDAYQAWQSANQAAVLLVYTDAAANQQALQLFHHTLTVAHDQ